VNPSAREALVGQDAGDGMVILDAHGFVRHCNAAAVRLLGAAEAEILGRGWDELGVTLQREDGSPLPPAEHPVALARSAGRPCRDVTMELRPSHGPPKRISATAEPVIEPDARAPLGLVLILHELTQAEGRDRGEGSPVRARDDESVRDSVLPPRTRDPFR